jgi:hypothetical protein
MENIPEYFLKKFIILFDNKKKLNKNRIILY